LTPDREDRIVTVSEKQRRELHAELVKKLGASVADTLMNHLPPAGWSDLARRSDLDQLESRMTAKFADLRSDIAEVRAWTGDKINGQTRWFVASQLVLVVAMISSITTIAH
jgi:hypothetical protein